MQRKILCIMQKTFHQWITILKKNIFKGCRAKTVFVENDKILFQLYFWQNFWILSIIIYRKNSIRKKYWENDFSWNIHFVWYNYNYVIYTCLSLKNLPKILRNVWIAEKMLSVKQTFCVKSHQSMFFYKIFFGNSCQKWLNFTIFSFLRIY